MRLTDLAGQVDFVLAFAVVHEMPGVSRFFVEASEVLKPSGQLLLVEPGGHVTTAHFDAELQAAVKSRTYWDGPISAEAIPPC
jgi:SAM-dependent methyltransferase